MTDDPTLDLMPVANPQLRERKRHRLVRKLVAYDPIGLAEPKYQLDHRDEVVAPSSLDQPCRDLLFRAQVAVGSALSSGIAEADLPEIVAEATLRRHEWEIAVALRDITDLRAEHELNAAESAGPMTDAVLEPQERALKIAQDGIVSRVTALERYAAEMTASANAFRDWQGALRASGLNDLYLDLVARTAADEHAVSEISGLTERAAEAARTFRESVSQVSQAAAALALPVPDPK
jgi:hypothetical protein